MSGWSSVKGKSKIGEPLKLYGPSRSGNFWSSYLLLNDMPLLRFLFLFYSSCAKKGIFSFRISGISLACVCGCHPLYGTFSSKELLILCSGSYMLVTPSSLLLVRSNPKMQIWEKSKSKVICRL